MKRYLHHLPAAVAGLLLVALIVLWFATTPGGAGTARNTTSPPVDDRLLKTARRLSALHATPDEQPLAAEALRVADHEVDLGFGTALREAAIPKPAAAGPVKEAADRIASLKTQIAAGEKQIDALNGKGDSSDTLELLKAQVALAKNELEDAREDLVRLGGDPRARVEQQLQEHQALLHGSQQSKPAEALYSSTLAGQLEAWLDLTSRRKQVQSAQKEAIEYAGQLRGRHQSIEQNIGSAGDPNDAENTAAVVARLKQLSNQKLSLSEQDKREQDSLQLAEVYRRWESAIDARRQMVLHDATRSLALILAIILAAILTGSAVRRALGTDRDRRRLHQVRVISSILVQGAAALLILLVIFGTPTQATTLIGLTTAGLTVALKDFVVAFFGWFALIGKNGIRIGDWVEIEGVGGEVIEIGLLKTVLLEMGNWTSTGHPTGRRVAFVNKYAIENHFFNFSTEGQWLWDELQVTLPLGANPYALSEQIRDTVARETESDAQLAEHEWERVTRQYGTRPFSGKPAIDLKPTVNGIDVVVRYITRAPQRYEVKSRLFSSIVGLLASQTADMSGTPANATARSPEPG